MTNKTLTMTDTLYDYLLSTSLREHPALSKLREVTHSLPGSIMQIAPEQGQFMALLVKLIGATKTLEVGTYTGYSAGVVAAALPADGKVVTCDIDEQHRQVAEQAWRDLGVIDRIDWRIGPAFNTLQELLDAGEINTFDFAFIDADKANYTNYYELCLQLLRPGGLIAIDNTLRRGRVADTSNNDKSTQAIRQLNKIVHRDERVTISLVPIADGLTLALKQ